jgi:hypothetical protein
VVQLYEPSEDLLQEDCARPGTSCQAARCPEPDSSTSAPDYELEALTFEPICPVFILMILEKENAPVFYKLKSVLAKCNLPFRCEVGLMITTCYTLGQVSRYSDCYGLDGRGFTDRLPTRAHSASYAMSAAASLLGGKVVRY